MSHDFADLVALVSENGGEISMSFRAADGWDPEYQRIGPHRRLVISAKLPNDHGVAFECVITRPTNGEIVGAHLRHATLEVNAKLRDQLASPANVLRKLADSMRRHT